MSRAIYWGRGKGLTVGALDRRRRANVFAVNIAQLQVTGLDHAKNRLSVGRNADFTQLSWLKIADLLTQIYAALADHFDKK